MRSGTLLHMAFSLTFQLPTRAFAKDPLKTKFNPPAIVQRTLAGGDDDIVAQGANPCEATGVDDDMEHVRHLQNTCVAQATCRFVISVGLVLTLIAWSITVWRHWRWRPLWLEHSIVVLLWSAKSCSRTLTGRTGDPSSYYHHSALLRANTTAAVGPVRSQPRDPHRNPTAFNSARTW